MTIAYLRVIMAFINHFPTNKCFLTWSWLPNIMETSSEVLSVIADKVRLVKSLIHYDYSDVCDYVSEREL